MNGPHDVGGQMGFGPVAPEPNEPMFHAGWEKRALGLTIAADALGLWNIDESRHAGENLHPADYYASSYYEIWIKALERLLERHGLVTREELRVGAAGATGARVGLDAERVMAGLARGDPYDRALAGPPRFAVGDAVRTRNIHPTGHTRLPRYARAKLGRVEAVRGGFVFPDSNAHSLGEAPQWVYAIAFRACELWGEAADPASTVSIDAWESYLEPV